MYTASLLAGLPFLLLTTAAPTSSVDSTLSKNSNVPIVLRVATHPRGGPSDCAYLNPFEYIKDNFWLGPATTEPAQFYNLTNGVLAALDSSGTKPVPYSVGTGTYACAVDILFESGPDYDAPTVGNFAVDEKSGKLAIKKPMQCDGKAVSGKHSWAICPGGPGYDYNGPVLWFGVDKADAEERNCTRVVVDVLEHVLPVPLLA